MTGGEGFDEMEELGRDREEWFRQFLTNPGAGVQAYPRGVSCHASGPKKRLYLR
ncbi:MAG: hypothetical protein LBP76_11735 [Treponema sp.]|nr:hypothetical protein [Treponema sp.]